MSLPAPNQEIPSGAVFCNPEPRVSYAEGQLLQFPQMPGQRSRFAALVASARADLFRRWAALSHSEIERRVTDAAQRVDVYALAEFSLFHTILKGQRGTRVSAETLTLRVDTLKRLCRDLHRLPGTLIEPGRDFGSYWVRMMEIDGLSAGTIRTRVKVARQIFAGFVWAGALSENPLEADQFSPDPEPDLDRAYTESELERIEFACDAWGRLAVLLASMAGLRESEVRALQWKHIDLEDRRLDVIKGKGGKDRKVPLFPRLLHELRKLAASGVNPEHYVVSGDTMYSKGNVRRRIRKCVERAGVKWKGRAYHGLRHSAGHLIYKLTRSKGAVADFLGHSREETAAIYSGRYPGLDALVNEHRDLYAETLFSSNGDQEPSGQKEGDHSGG